MRRYLLALVTAVSVMFPNTFTQAAEPLRILAMGDSMMASHRLSRRAVSHSIARALGAKVTDQSVMGARIIYRLPITGAMGLNIGRQYRKGDWDWIVLNGGGNDLWLGCGCSRCHRRMDQLVTKKGNGGEIAKLIVKLRKTGAKVAYVGYLRSPGAGSPIEHCRDDGDELERRLKRLAGLVDGFYYVSVADLVPHGDMSFHALDMIHPSLKGSRVIGQRVAATIKAVEARR
ncbi:SGNH/GDSL hydrolase family protein [Pseudohalocynthiibacter aestuariivivens]|uniref:SGNH/GDSL hydrolase family protein n=1 Tax=Roseovarius pelagicus TaxID=2980108 RepID=A0ABY6D9Z8_9RHOB|nr:MULTISPECIES: SGNH/GDSL hydrolase family protein [Rhodobacterales]QIE46031.1 SGNH/GDSL hydrolase family protein [Pseudohalocynthiibacter aestuariivivens]UXX82008.1 SGNH/GDSL hydrolase family protein [Roseovarius pelagicus]